MNNSFVFKLQWILADTAAREMCPEYRNKLDN